ncbi:hypothetical protein ZWY2020_031481 [Hordeum vulgare]|nr:hypothetical protein ZWY2020_031481 [Hordeum vulgare]
MDVVPAAASPNIYLLDLVSFGRRVLDRGLVLPDGEVDNIHLPVDKFRLLRIDDCIVLTVAMLFEGGSRLGAFGSRYAVPSCTPPPVDVLELVPLEVMLLDEAGDLLACPALPWEEDCALQSLMQRTKDKNLQNGTGKKWAGACFMVSTSASSKPKQFPMEAQAQS